MKERHRDARRLIWLDDFRRDVAYGSRVDTGDPQRKDILFPRCLYTAAQYHYVLLYGMSWGIMGLQGPRKMRRQLGLYDSYETLRAWGTVREIGHER